MLKSVYMYAFLLSVSFFLCATGYLLGFIVFVFSGLFLLAQVSLCLGGWLTQVLGIVLPAPHRVP